MQMSIILLNSIWAFILSHLQPILDAKLEAITNWLAQNQLVDVSANLSTLQSHNDTLQENVDRRLRELSAEITITRSAVGSGSVGFSEPRPEKDRNVFDPQDYKLGPVEAKPSLGKWKKWR